MGKICPYCKSENNDTAKFCSGCGAPLTEDAGVQTDTPDPAPEVQPKPAYEAKPYSEPASGSSYQSSYQSAPYNEVVTPIPVGGMTAWAIVIILFCTIPGIVSLVKVLGINNARTYSEQQERLANAKTWLIVGTVLGALSAISLLGRMMMYR